MDQLENLQRLSNASNSLKGYRDQAYLLGELYKSRGAFPKRGFGNLTAFAQRHRLYQEVTKTSAALLTDILIVHLVVHLKDSILVGLD